MYNLQHEWEKLVHYGIGQWRLWLSYWFQHATSTYDNYKVSNRTPFITHVCPSCGQEKSRVKGHPCRECIEL